MVILCWLANCRSMVSLWFVSVVSALIFSASCWWQHNWRKRNVRNVRNVRTAFSLPILYGLQPRSQCTCRGGVRDRWNSPLHRAPGRHLNNKLRSNVMKDCLLQYNHITTGKTGLLSRHFLRVLKQAHNLDTS